MAGQDETNAGPDAGPDPTSVVGTTATITAPAVVQPDDDAAAPAPDHDHGPLGSARAAGSLGAPSAVGTFLGNGPAPGATLVDRPEWARYARSPLPQLGVAAVVTAVAVGVYRWALESVSGGGTGGLPLQWWDGITRLALQDQQLGPAGTNHGRLAWAVAAAAVAFAAIVVWLRRIGQNGRADAGMFGSVLAVAALLAWWTLPLSVGSVDPNLTETRVRLVIAAVALLVQTVLARWVLIHKLWRTGHLRIEAVATAFWVPLFAVNAAVLGVLTWHFVKIDAKSFDAAWTPDASLVRAEQWVCRATGLGVLGLAIAVSVIQHRGIAETRRRAATDPLRIRP